VLAGLIVMGVGFNLLTRLGHGSTQTDLTVAMVVLGLGAVMQTYVLIVQNVTSRADLGIATSVTQLTRSMGATFGTAIFGTVMVSSMKSEVPKHLPAEAEWFSGGVGSLLDPDTLGQLPPAIATGLREGLATAMHSVFLVGLVIIGIALVASIFINELPLRDTAYADEVIGEQVEPDLGAVERAHERRDERKDREHRP
jgi:hypothetical protein